MFKRLQWKIVVMFVLLVMAIMFIAFGFMTVNTVHFYERDFKNKTESVLRGEFTDGVINVLKSDDENKQAKLLNVISAYSSQLGLGNDRKCSVLLASDGSEIASTIPQSSTAEKTPNIITAMTGKTGDKFVFMSDYMDYAHFIRPDGTNDGYIIYVRDNKRSITNLMKNMMSIILQALLFGIAASIVLGYFLSRTITMPITVLTEKAEDFAEGKFDSNLEVTSADEIGTLMETFNYMGKIMNRALNEIAGEKHKIEIILEHVTNGIIAFNTEQNIIHINSAAKKLLNIDNPENVKFDEFFERLEANVCMAEFMYLEKTGLASIVARDDPGQRIVIAQPNPSVTEQWQSLLTVLDIANPAASTRYRMNDGVWTAYENVSLSGYADFHEDLETIERFTIFGTHDDKVYVDNFSVKTYDDFYAEVNAATEANVSDVIEAFANMGIITLSDDYATADKAALAAAVKANAAYTSDSEVTFLINKFVSDDDIIIMDESISEGKLTRVKFILSDNVTATSGKLVIASYNSNDALVGISIANVDSLESDGYNVVTGLNLNVNGATKRKYMLWSDVSASITPLAKATEIN